jgi:hypothetical protein
VTLSALTMNNSSKTNGIARANANGHPTIAPVANSSVAKSVLSLFFILDGSKANAYANVVVYIAKEDGRKAKIFSDFIQN